MRGKIAGGLVAPRFLMLSNELAIDDNRLNLTAPGTEDVIADLTCVNKNDERVVLRATVA
jgi:hypothetical protein